MNTTRLFIHSPFVVMVLIITLANPISTSSIEAPHMGLNDPADEKKLVLDLGESWSPYGDGWEYLGEEIDYLEDSEDYTSAYMWRNLSIDEHIAVTLIDYVSDYRALVFFRTNVSSVESLANKEDTYYRLIDDSALNGADAIFQVDHNVVCREWVQGSYLIIMSYAAPEIDSAIIGSRECARTLSENMSIDNGLTLQKLEENYFAGRNIGFIALFTLYGLFIGIMRIRLIRREKELDASEEGAIGYQDISTEIKSKKRAKSIRTVVGFCALVLTAFLLTTVVFAIRSSSFRMDEIIIIIVYILAMLLLRFIARRNSRDIAESTFPISGSTSIKGIVGSAIIWLANFLEVSFIFCTVFFAVLATYSLPASIATTVFKNNQFGLLAADIAGLIHYSPPALFIAVVVLFSVLMVVLYRSGLWLRTASLEEAGKRNPQHILYLRAFEEDRLRLAPGLFRRNAISKLVPVFRVRFEEVLVQQLNLVAPVWAAAEREASFKKPPGASRIILPNEGECENPVERWEAAIENYAGNAEMIVIGATPDSVRSGLSVELDIVNRLWLDEIGVISKCPQNAIRLFNAGKGVSAREKKPVRILLVFGPWGEDTKRRIELFAKYSSQYELFRPLTKMNLPEGALAAFYSRETGWFSYGSSFQDDWSYAMAIDKGLEVFFEEEVFLNRAWIPIAPVDWFLKTLILKSGADTKRNE